MRLRTASSASSLRLAATGGLLHWEGHTEDSSSDSNSNSMQLPSFEDTTRRWAGPQTGNEDGGASSIANGENKQVQDGPPASFWPDWNWSGHETSAELEIEYTGSDCESEPVTPTFQVPKIPERVKVSPPKLRGEQQDTQRTPTKPHSRPRPQQMIPGLSHSEDSRSTIAAAAAATAKAIEAMDEEGGEPENRYSSLEQMLAKSGFEQCRVVTPPDSAQKPLRAHTSTRSPSPLATGPIDSPPSPSETGAEHSMSPSPSPSPEPIDLASTAAALSLSRASKSAPAVGAENKSSSSGNTLRGKPSLLSLTASAAAGFVSGLWAASAPPPVPSLPAVPAAAGKKRTPAAVAIGRLDDDRKATIRGWLAQTAQSMAALSSPPTAAGAALPPADESASISAGEMYRTGTESTLESSAMVETPSDSPAGSAFFAKEKHGAGADEQPALTASSLSRLRHALSDGALHLTSGAATLPSRPVVQIKPAAAAAHPSIASIFGSMLPSFPAPPLALAHVQEEREAEIALPPTAVTAPGPQLLRKTASQHTLRKAARPILSEATVTAAAGAGSTDSVGTPGKAGNGPRQVKHRNPRDSPVGETRVLKSSSGGSPGHGSDSPFRSRVSLQDTPVKSANSQEKGKGKAPSILDAADQEGGLWTSPSAGAAPAPTRSPLVPRPDTNAALPPAGTAPRRPQLRAKESLEHILAVRKRQEAAEQTRIARDRAQTEKAQAQVRQRSPEGRKALGRLSSFHREPLGQRPQTALQEQQSTLAHQHEQLSQDRAQPNAALEKSVAKHSSAASAEQMQAQARPPLQRSGIHQSTPCSPPSPSVQPPQGAGKSKLVRGPAVVGAAPRRAPAPPSAVTVAPPPATSERSFTGTLGRLIGTAMDWIAEDPPESAYEEECDAPLPRRSSSSRHTREGASTMRGPTPAQSSGMYKRESVDAFQAGARRGTKKLPQSPRPSLNHGRQYAAAPQSQPMARRAHSLPVPTIVISEPTSD